MRVIGLLFTAVAVAGGRLTGPAFAASDANAWLARLTLAEKRKSFTGQFIFG